MHVAVNMQRELPVLTARAVVAPSHSQHNTAENWLKQNAKIEPRAKALWKKILKADMKKNQSLEVSEVNPLSYGREVNVTITINVEGGKIKTKEKKEKNAKSERKRNGSSSDSEKEEEDDEDRKKRRKSIANEDGLSRYVRSGYPCDCLCGCRARWKEQVCCVQCRRYITGNINACNCCMIVHPDTDDAMCHMCHNEEYAASSGLEVRKPEEGESDDVRKDNKTRWREGLASTGTQTSRWSLQQHRPPPEGVESSTSVADRQKHADDGSFIQ